MAQAEVTRGIEERDILTEQNISTDNIVKHRVNGRLRGYYLPYIGKEERHRFYFLRGSCCAVVGEGDDAHACGDDAAYRRVNSSGIEEYCLTHAPDQWDVITEEARNLDNCIIDLRSSCEKCVSKSVSHDGDDPLIKPNSCGDRAAILVTAPDGDDISSKAYCLKHAMDDWKFKVHLPTGFPGDPRLEGDAGKPSKGTAYFVDAPTGRVFESYTGWEQGVQDRYRDITEAEKHVVCLDSDGETVL